MGMTDDLERILEKMWRAEHGYFQGIALAKLYEHRKKDPASALHITETLLRAKKFLPSHKRVDLERRRERLLRKQGKYQLTEP
jgi:hypothetical protein